MILRRHLLGLTLGMLVALAAISRTAAVANETISGSVIDGTSGGTLASGIVITLQGIDPNQKVVAQQETTADADGHFRFDQVTANPGLTYVVSTRYGGVLYQSVVPKPTGSRNVSLKLKVYEPTTRDTAVSLRSVSWLMGTVDVQNQQILVLGLLTVDNHGDRTYVGDHRSDPGSMLPAVLPRTLRLTLPDGSSDFQPQMGMDPAKLLPVANGYADTEPIMPGKHDLAYTYRIGYADGAVEFQISFPYSTDQLRFLAPDINLVFRSDQLHDTGTTQVEGQTFRILEADNLPAGTPVTLDVFGLPTVSQNRLGSTDLRVIGGIVAALVLLAPLALGLRKQDISSAPPDGERYPHLVAIAQLDNLYAAGQLNQEAYEMERARRKRELIDLIYGEKTPGTDGSVSPEGPANPTAPILAPAQGHSHSHAASYTHTQE